MNEDSQVSESGVESGSSDSQDVQYVTGVDYSGQLDNIYELQYWQFGLLSVYVGLFVAVIILMIINRHF